ncbi:MAG: hypothetical protein O7D86_12790 [Proteobacteria bacterium]|nr:hypothetical protein [Pseudomonadota bacterium]
MKYALLILLCLSLAACQTWTQIKDDDFMKGPKNAFMIKLPNNWMHASLVNDRIIVTRDGISVQYIKVIRMSPDDAFEKIEKKANSKMLPEELAELTLAEIRKEESIGGSLKVLENSPVKIGNYDGYRLHIEFKNLKGLRFERIIYGLLDDEYVIRLTYQAPMLYFFERDLNTFENTVKTFQIAI